MISPLQPRVPCSRGSPAAEGPLQPRVPCVATLRRAAGRKGDPPCSSAGPSKNPAQPTLGVVEQADPFDPLGGCDFVPSAYFGDASDDESSSEQHLPPQKKIWLRARRQGLRVQPNPVEHVSQ